MGLVCSETSSSVSSREGHEEIEVSNITLIPNPVAYPGGFLVARNPPSGHDFFFNQGVTPILTPTFTSHLDV